MSKSSKICKSVLELKSVRFPHPEDEGDVVIYNMDLQQVHAKFTEILGKEYADRMIVDDPDYDLPVLFEGTIDEYLGHLYILSS